MSQKVSTQGGAVVSLWVIYENPSDFPGKHVARRHESPGGPTADVIVAPLDELRARMLAEGRTYLSRFPDDDPCILETWL